MSKRQIRLLVSAFLALLGLLVSPGTPLGAVADRAHLTSWSSSSTYPVVHVVDGDTIDVMRGGEKVRIRLIGIDTPESVDPRRPVECFGKEASARARELLEGARVGVELDPSQGELDKYGRTLAYARLPDGRILNQVMIEEGYAHEYTYRLPYRYQTEFKSAERSAREGERGLWSSTTCSGD